MVKTILITGATDGIGLVTAKMLAQKGHRLLLHGRNPAKLEATAKSLSGFCDEGQLETFVADLSDMDDVEALARSVSEGHDSLDVLINNAGIFRTPEPITATGLDVRFAVNTLAPYRLTQRLLPLIPASGRVVNLSSAAQAPVDLQALAGEVSLADEYSAYAQSKLAITMWSRSLAQKLGADGPVIIAVNPGSLLASKMVTEGFGVPGKDINIGAEILIRAALSDDFASASGRYFDNDSGDFADPHRDALDDGKCAALVAAIEDMLAD